MGDVRPQWGHTPYLSLSRFSGLSACLWLGMRKLSGVLRVIKHCRMHRFKFKREEWVPLRSSIWHCHPVVLSSCILPSGRVSEIIEHPLSAWGEVVRGGDGADECPRNCRDYRTHHIMLVIYLRHERGHKSYGYSIKNTAVPGTAAQLVLMLPTVCSNKPGSYIATRRKRLTLTQQAVRGWHY